MTTICLSVVATFYLSSCNYTYKSDECDKIRTGFFYQLSEITNDTIEIRRTDSFQVEKNLTTGLIKKRKVKWIQDSCIHLLIPFVDNSNTGSGTDSFLNVTTFKIYINDVQKEYYTYESRVDSSGKHLLIRDTIFIKQLASP